MEQPFLVSPARGGTTPACRPPPGGARSPRIASRFLPASTASSPPVAAARSTRRRPRRRRPDCRSCRCRRRTRAQSGPKFPGVRDPGKRMVGGGGGANPRHRLRARAHARSPRPQSGGTAMNALAHCVEALYRGDLDSARRGAALIVEWLPRVLENLRDLEARTHLLEGAAAAGEALAAHGLSSATRWPRPSAAATGCLTARSTQSACPRRCASTPTWRRSRSRSCPSRPWKSWRDSPASRAFAISEFPTPIWTSWPRRSRAPPGRARTRARPPAEIAELLRSIW